MRIELDRMTMIKPQDKKQSLKFLRSKFCYLQAIGDVEMALRVLDEIDGCYPLMNEDDKTRHLVDKFIFFIQINELKEARNILEFSKKFRKFSLSENYNYMKKMLDHLIHNTPLYVYENDFKNTPVLFDQIKFIQLLEEKNLVEARKIWLKLSDVSPGIYKDFLEYAGRRSLFSLCLEKHKGLQSFSESISSTSYSSKLDSLIDHLSKANSPLRASHLYELVWGECAESKEDLVKVSRLIYRAKIERNLNIEYRKGTYLLRRDVFAKSS